MNPPLEPSSQPPPRGFPVAFLIGAVLVLCAVGVVWFLSSMSGGGDTPRPLPFGLDEQQYAARIRFLDFKLSRAENMLGQEVTFIECTIENAGTGIIRELEVELEFYNLEDQLVLRESRRLLGRYTAPMDGGRFRKVDMNFERLPADWNQHPPKVRITGLDFEP